MKLYVVSADVPEDSGLEKCICGVFSCADEALQHIRNLKGEDCYEGEYTEKDLDGESGEYFECNYATVGDDNDGYLGTRFIVEKVELGKFMPPSF